MNDLNIFFNCIFLFYLIIFSSLQNAKWAGLGLGLGSEIKESKSRRKN